MTKKIDKNTKKKFLEGHFFYEVDNMMECICEVRKENPDESKILIKNYIAVAFFTHVRNLWEFFYSPDNKPKKSPRVNHYIPNWDIKASSEISERYGKINKHISHLDYDRVNDTGLHPLAYIYDIYNHFRKLIKNFWEKLQQEYLKGSNLKKLKEKIEADIINHS